MPRFFFNSREETRLHVHVETADGTAKFWLEPLIALATSHNLATKELATAESIVKDRADDFSVPPGNVTLDSEVTNIAAHGFWLLVNDQEYFVPFTDYPVF